MSVRRVAMISAHTSPLAQPGAGHGGGMNVYVRSLAVALARAGVEVDVLARADHPLAAPVVDVEPGFRVLHLEAGPPEPLETASLAELVGDLVEVATAHLAATPRYDAVHAHYWVSGAIGHQLKHDFDVPLVTTFHTLAHTKIGAGLSESSTRLGFEQDTVRCSDRIVASTPHERAELIAGYGADRDRIEVVAPGVDHSLFFPGVREVARHRLGLPEDGPVLAFVGRIQPLKGVDVALRAFAALEDPRAVLVVVGGPSGPEGGYEVAALRQLAHDLRIEDRVRWVAPRPHAELADWYRAADVCVVPSLSESFGLVALEAAACGTPVVAAAVGGLRSLVQHGRTGFLVSGRDPRDYAAAISRVLSDPELAHELSVGALMASRDYTWSMTAARLRRVYADLATRALVQCA
jgi:D-inositol-3-phosphate glycosyltransferase